MPKKIPDEIRVQAIQLRQRERLSVMAVSQRLGVSKATVSGWLKPYPLDPEEIHSRKVLTGLRQGRCPRATEPESSLHQMLGGREPDPVAKARIAEAAILLRVVLMGWDVYGSVFDGSKFDWIVNVGGHLVRLQVKSMSMMKKGSPLMRLLCSEGRGKSRRYKKDEFDFAVGYDLFADRAYVWSWPEVKDRTTVSAHPDAIERWDKILGPVRIWGGGRTVDPVRRGSIPPRPAIYAPGAR